MNENEKNNEIKPVAKKRNDRQIWLSVSESAKLGGIDAKTVRRAIKNKKIKYKVCGNRYAIRLYSLIEFVHENAKLRNKFYHCGLGQYIDKFKKTVPTK